MSVLVQPVLMYASNSGEAVDRLAGVFKAESDFAEKLFVLCEKLLVPGELVLVYFHALGKRFVPLLEPFHVRLELFMEPLHALVGPVHFFVAFFVALRECCQLFADVHPLLPNSADSGLPATSP